MVIVQRSDPHLYVYGVLIFEAMATFVSQVSVLSLIAIFGAATTAMKQNVTSTKIQSRHFLAVGSSEGEDVVNSSPASKIFSGRPSWLNTRGNPRTQPNPPRLWAGTSGFISRIPGKLLMLS
ncbi:uncharacterized protein LOC110109653 [Dendrobium catenatum]|uniref:uncharacterized protein LOC110109653 n=1 Tax=Dendrobium catenatum TaxID=906689 RepID=UPI0010A0AB18|nr:uncharacterized protein LOC110109653 [Dendrobium catenatum]